MGQPMMIHHADGTQSVATTEGMRLIAAEADINNLFFWNRAPRRYGIAIKWDRERKLSYYTVGDREEEDGGVPAEVYDAAQESITLFEAMLDRHHETDMFERSAPLFLADALEANPDWYAVDEGEDGAVRTIERRVGDYDEVFVIIGTQGTQWGLLSYPTYEPTAWRIDEQFDNLADAVARGNEILDNL